MDSRNRKLLINTSVFAISNFASKILVFLMLPIYTSVLSTKEYGSADLLISITTLCMPFLTVCIADAALRFALRDEADKCKIFTYGIVVILCGIFVLGLFFPVLIKFDFIGENLIFVYIISIPCYFADYFSKFARGVNKVKHVGIAGVISTFTMITNNILCLVILEIGIKGYLLSFGITYLTTAVYLLCVAKLYKYFSISYLKEMDIGLIKNMLKYSFPLMPNQACWWINDTANKYIINGFCGTSAVGLYSAASRVPAIFTTVQSFFSDAWLLSAIEEEKSKDSKQFYIQYYDIYCALATVICSSLMMFSKVICLLLYSDEFKHAEMYVPGLLLSSLFGGLVGFIGAFFNAYKKTQYLFSSTIIGAISSMMLNFVLTPIIGIYGAVVANVTSYFIIWLIRFIESRKILDIRLHFRKTGAAFLVLLIQIVICSSNCTSCIYYLVNITAISVLVFLWRREMKPIVKKGISFIEKSVIK